MSILALILFFVYTWGLGFSVTRLVKESESVLERLVMRVGIGLCAFIVLGIVLNTLRVLLDWRIFLIISAAGPIAWLFRRKGSFNFHPSFSLKVKSSSLVAICVLAILAFSIFMYVSGAFKYSYFEDDDPWTHARGVSYVSVEKTAFSSPNLHSQYMDPYPPGYDLMMGILTQPSSSLYWTLKFFNAFLIAISVIFFFFFAKEFFGSRAKALFATFVLASVPAYLSHFIWAPALAMVVFFPVMYAFEMVKKDKRWWIVAGICLSSLFLVHPTQAASLAGFIAIFLVIRAAYEFFSEHAAWLRQSLTRIQAVALGAILSLFWWGLKWKAFIPNITQGFKGGPSAASATIQSAPNIFSRVLSIITHALDTGGGTATRVYVLRDFVVASSANMINNPIGLGVFVSLLSVAGLASAVVTTAKLLPRPRILVPLAIALAVFFTLTVASHTFSYQEQFFQKDAAVTPQDWPSAPSYFGVLALSATLVSLVVAFLLSIVAMVFSRAKQEKRLVIVSIILGWLIFAFLGVNSETFNLPVGLFAFRFWMILAVPVALIAAEGLFGILGFVGKLNLEKPAAMAIQVAIILLVIMGVFFTSTRQKFDVNTACWPAGAFWSGNLVRDPQSGCPTQSEVLTYKTLTALPPKTKVFTFSNPDQVIGFGAYSCGWCTEESEMKAQFYNVTPSGLHSFLVQNNYKYFIIGGIEIRNFGYNETVRLINSVASSSLFTIDNQGEAAILFRVV